MTTFAGSFISLVTHASASTQRRVVNAVGVDVANVFLRAIRFDFNAIDSIPVVPRSAHALIPIEIPIQLAVGERMAVVHHIARD